MHQNWTCILCINPMATFWLNQSVLHNNELFEIFKFIALLWQVSFWYNCMQAADRFTDDIISYSKWNKNNWNYIENWMLIKDTNSIYNVKLLNS